MSIFISHAPADREVAENLEKFLERRGQFVELDDGQTALRPVTPHDVLLLLVSKDLVFAPMRLRLEQRALDAWADGRLIVIKLDHGIAPVGLRDLPAIDASFAAQREFKWQEAADAIRKTLATPPPGLQTRSAPAAPPVVRPKRKGGGWLGWLVCLLLILPGLFALAASGSIWLVNRIGPAPGAFADLLAGIDALGARAGLAVGVTPTLFALAIALMLLAPLWLLIAAAAARRRRRAASREHPELAEDYEAPPTSPTQAPSAVFVSYSRANAQSVLPVIEAAKQNGHKFWLDQQSIASGDSWAGEIVRAIRNAAGVIVMCSKAAFESDHVKREVYLADRYHRKLIPVFIEDATPPEDFEYFFAGVQQLKLFETPEGERSQVLSQLLGAAA